MKFWQVYQHIGYLKLKMGHIEKLLRQKIHKNVQNHNVLANNQMVLLGSCVPLVYYAIYQKLQCYIHNF